MNFKKIFAGALSLAMALSTVNFSYAEPTGEFVEVGGTFVSDIQGFKTRNGQDAVIEFTSEMNHSEDNTGALKIKAESMPATDMIVAKPIDSLKLKENEAYCLTAYVYSKSRAKAENGTSSIAYIGIDDAFKGSMWNYMDGSISKAPYSTVCSPAVTLTDGEWQKLSVYFLGQKSMSGKKLSIAFRQVQAKTDVYYIDDVTIEKCSKADDFFNSLKSGPKTKYDKSVTADYNFRALDISETKDVLTVGESVDLIAYSQDTTKTTAAEVEASRAKADVSKITATSDDSDIADYINGKIVAKACGNTVIKFTYVDGDTKVTSNLLVTVHPGNENSYSMSDDDTSYAKFTDPLDNNNSARIAYGNIQTTIPANTPVTASFRVYYTGVKAVNSQNPNDLGKAGVMFNTNPTESAYVAGGRWVDRYVEVEYRDKTGGWINADGTVSQLDGVSQSRNTTLTAGWNNVDIVTDYPKMGSYADNYMSVKFYINGTEVSGDWSYGNLRNLKEIKVNPNKNIAFSAFSQITMVDDINIVSMNESLKVIATSPAAGETLSTLDDIDVKFNSLTTVSDIENCATLYQGDAVVDTVKVMSTDNKRLSVIPQGGLKPNTEYTLRLDANSFKDTLENTLTGTTEFKFTTNNVKVSDVIGSGYKLLNSQLDMIANGNYTLSSATSEKLADNTLHASAISKKQGTAFSVAADDKFTTDSIKADKVVVEFDTKTDAVYNEGREPLSQCERWVVNAKDAKDNSAQISAIGGADYWATNFFVNYYKFMLDEEGNRVADGTDGKYKLYTYIENNQTKTLISDPIVDRYFNIYNKGYVHVKIEYDLNNGNKEGDVTQTVTLTMEDGTVYKKTLPATVMVNGYPDVTAITSLNVIMNQLEVDIDDKTKLGAFASRDVYLKNVNMYALQNDPASIPDAEIKVTEILNSGLNSIQNAAGLNGQTVYVSATLTNNKLGDNAPYVLVAAAYDKATNKLIDVDIAAPGTISNTETTDVKQFELDLTSFTEGTAEIRVFAWNSLDGAVPLTEVYKPF